MTFNLLVLTAVLAQAQSVGIFSNSGDVGGPAIKGSTQFSDGQYRITGSGANIWAKQDQFQFVWREITGNFTVTATLRFLGQGSEHRKAGIMVRQSLDTDATYADVVIHGNGMPGVQFRTTKADNTNTVDLPIEGPGTFKLRLVRVGSTITVWSAKNGAPLRELGHTANQLGSPVLLGLGVSSHTQAAANTVLFSDLTVEQLASPATRKK